jgi:hypothetical protein
VLSQQQAGAGYARPPPIEPQQTGVVDAPVPPDMATDQVEQVPPRRIQKPAVTRKFVGNPKNVRQARLDAFVEKTE